MNVKYKDLKIRAKTIKVLEENLWVHDIDLATIS
jgi:hypothetical protein